MNKVERIDRMDSNKCSLSVVDVNPWGSVVEDCA